MYHDSVGAIKGSANMYKDAWRAPYFQVRQCFFRLEDNDAQGVAPIPCERSIGVLVTYLCGINASIKRRVNFRIFFITMFAFLDTYEDRACIGIVLEARVW